MEKEIVITYETLFEILRREKAREELQELPENFSEEVKKYLKEKKQTMLSLSGDQFSELEQEKTQRQIVNIKKILNELYEKREKKIINMALSKSRMPRSVIDTSKLAPQEKQLFGSLIETFDSARQTALKEILLESAGVPAEPRAAEAENEKSAEKAAPESAQDQAAVEEPAGGAVKEPAEASAGTKTVRFLCDVSQFVGPNLEIYGPFRTDETALLPCAVCEVLINREKARFDSQEGQSF